MWQERRQRNMTEDIKENNRQVQGMERRFQIDWKGPITKATDMKQPIICLGRSASMEALAQHLKKYVHRL